MRAAMAQITITGQLRQYTGGVSTVDLEVANVRQMLGQLGEQFPELAPHLVQGIAVAIDGQIFQDALFQPIPPNSEVHILPAIAGG
jgi:sulfur-carrier protein